MEINGLHYRVRHVYYKKELNYPFLVTISKPDINFDKKEIALNDIEDLFTFIKNEEISKDYRNVCKKISKPLNSGKC